MDEVEIIDQDVSRYGSKDLSPKQIILNHINRISKYIFSGEQEPMTKESKTGAVKTVDRRQIIIQAIEFLVSTLQPFYDEKMDNSQTKFNTFIKELEEKLVTSAINFRPMEKGGRKNFQEWQKFLTKNLMISISKETQYYEHYLSVKYSAYMNLFQEQNYLLKRMNYLTSSGLGESE